jgi:UDP-3-O-[3-hydroxymyristoyl] glucosamine N-acyltransferase
MKTLEQIAAAVGGRLDGPPGLVLRRVAPPEEAGAEDLAFAKDERHLALVAGSRAGAVLCREGDEVGGRPAVRVENPRLAAARAVAFLSPEPTPPPGVHRTAVLGPGARLGEGASVGPYAVVGAGSTLGARVTVGAHAVVGEGCRVGDDTRLDPHVILYPGVTVGARCRLHAGVVVGAEGFGFEPDAAGPVGFPQRGTVVLGDDVRVGANTTIDRATFGTTRVADGAKLDNLVQVAHNASIGRGALLCAFAGVAGGAVVEDRAVLGPQAALSPDAVLGAGTILGPRAALASRQRLSNPGKVWMDAPPMPLAAWKRWTVGRLRSGRDAPSRGRQDLSMPRSRKDT